METATIIISVVYGIYTVLARVIPTSKTWCTIGLVINAAKGISDALDNKKKK